MSEKISKVAAVIPNLNGQDYITDCITSLQAQSYDVDIIVVDNGSTDASVERIKSMGPGVVNLIQQPVNLGFAGGVNVGIKEAIEKRYDYVFLFNNDAKAEQSCVLHLVRALDTHPDVGIVTAKILDANGEKIDSTGDFYSAWGLPFPRGRGELDNSQYDDQTEVFGASGGASLYRVSMLEQIGLFDEDFFAYYEDVDISFRAQLSGWHIRFEPKSRVYHQINATSNKMYKGFTTYHTFKNLSLLYKKNVPSGMRWQIGKRFWLAYKILFLSALSKGKGWPAMKGYFKTWSLRSKVKRERRRIQEHSTVTNEYIAGMIYPDLPESYIGLRKLFRKGAKKK